MANFDGAWRARYESEFWGEGVVVMRGGKFLGCDQQYFLGVLIRKQTMVG
jgi:hypothetical protein